MSAALSDGLSAAVDLTVLVAESSLSFSSAIHDFLLQNPYTEEDLRRNKECSSGISNVHAVKVNVENGSAALRRCVLCFAVYEQAVCK